MNTLFWWTGLLLWAFGAVVGLGMVALWVRGKMMARGAGKRGIMTGQSRSVASEEPAIQHQATDDGAALAPAPHHPWPEAIRIMHRQRQKGFCVTPCTLDELMPTVVDRDS